METESEPLLTDNGVSFNSDTSTEKRTIHNYVRDVQDMQIVTIFVTAFDTKHGGQPNKLSH